MEEAKRVSRKGTRKPAVTKARLKETVNYLLTDDGAMLLECMARDGYTIGDIAKRFGLSRSTMEKLRRRYAKIDRAISSSRELVDYKVENAILKAALGYRETEVKVTEEIRHGKVVSTFRETYRHTVPPNVKAGVFWLTNRNHEKWKKNRDNVFDASSEEQVSITISRAGAPAPKEIEPTKNEVVVDAEDPETTDYEPENDGETLDYVDDVPDEVNDSATYRDMTPEERRMRDMEDRAAKRERERRKRFGLIGDTSAENETEVSEMDSWDGWEG